MEYVIQKNINHLSVEDLRRHFFLKGIRTGVIKNMDTVSYT